MICPGCGVTLEPKMVEDLSGQEIHFTLRYGNKEEPVYFCPNGCRLYQTETETVQRIRRNKPKAEFVRRT